jgi:hypothetical protein
VGERPSCDESRSWTPAISGRYHFCRQIWDKESNNSGRGQHPTADLSAPGARLRSIDVRKKLLVLTCITSFVA